ncbi:hypothetical protein I4U23_023569 [Adineta vaga]|nr:hypothetical protein I4U23_023569 [Adineta vaga]
MALGRTFYLGMLYDFKTDKSIPNISLWDNRLIANYIKRWSVPSSSYEIHAEDTLIKRLEFFKADSNLKLSILTGLVVLTHSAKLIDDHKTTEHIRRYVVKYSVTTQQHELSTSHLNINNSKCSPVIDDQNATHIVTGILYGADVYFVFDRPVKLDENHEITDRIVIELLRKMITNRFSRNNELILKDDEKKLTETLTCRYYGDLDFISPPTTFEQVARLFRQVPQLLDDNSIPKQVWLYPLYLFNKIVLVHRTFPQITYQLVTRTIELFEEFYRLKIKINNLKNSIPPNALLRQSEL